MSTRTPITRRITRRGEHPIVHPMARRSPGRSPRPPQDPRHPQAQRRRRGLQRVQRDDRGYSIVETAIVMPALMLGIMVVVQMALVWHARHAAAEAAGRGAEAARAYQASQADGSEAARSYLQDVAPKLLQDPAVSVSRSATEVQVTVSAHVLAVVPVMPGLHVTQSATAPVERFVSAPR